MNVPATIPDAARTQVERVQISARHLLQLIEEVLTFSRLEAGREEIWIEKFDLAELARETSLLVEPLAAQKDLRFTRRIPDVVIDVESDPGKIRQILLNLLSNAIKFTDRGEIELSVGSVGDGVALQVRDTGLGIPADRLSEIFEPFRQIEGGPTRQVGGTGLGLSVTRSLAELLGGDVVVDSVPGSGSVFTVRLPRRSATA